MRLPPLALQALDRLQHPQEAVGDIAVEQLAGMPSVSSSWRMVRLTAGCETLSSFAARVKEPQRAAASKTSR